MATTRVVVPERPQIAHDQSQLALLALVDPVRDKIAEQAAVGREAAR